VLDKYPFGAVGTSGSGSGSKEPNWNQVQVLELTELELTRSRVEYGIRRELRGLVRPVCRTKTWPWDRFQVGKKTGTGSDFWNSVPALYLGLGLGHPLVLTFDQYGCPVAYFTNCFLLVHYSFFFSEQTQTRSFLFQVLKCKE